MAKKDVISLAKSGKATAKKPAARKPAVKKPAARKRKPAVKKVEPVKTPEEIRDQKAKETVEKLLEDSPIVTLDKKDDDDLLILDETPEEPKGVEWLEEQIGLLTQKNEAVTAELDVVKIENEQLRGGVAPPAPNVIDGEVKGNVIKLFDELQTQLVNRGINPNTGNPNFVIHTVPFMNRLIKFFPFLEQMKKYK